LQSQDFDVINRLTRNGDGEVLAAALVMRRWRSHSISTTHAPKQKENLRVISLQELRHRGLLQDHEHTAHQRFFDIKNGIERPTIRTAVSTFRFLHAVNKRVRARHRHAGGRFRRDVAVAEWFVFKDFVLARMRRLPALASVCLVLVLSPATAALGVVSWLKRKIEGKVGSNQKKHRTDLLQQMNLYE
jgi:hypothetical protein